MTVRHIRKFLSQCFLCACVLAPQGSFAASKPGAAARSETVARADSVLQQNTGESMAQKKFLRWLKELRREAVAKGISKKTIDAALPDTLRLLPHVVKSDRSQPEKKQKIDDYLKLTITQARCDTGRVRMKTHSAILGEVEGAFGVESEVTTSLWGMESSFGKNTGKVDIIRSLATLAYDGRRSAFFRGELFNALRIMDEGYIPLSSLKGSWAGAMGQIQFMPSSYLTFAVDFDKDGHRDIWKNHADIFGSAANYLSKSGWKKGQRWGERISLPASFDRSLLGLDKGHPVSFWRQRGLRPLESDTCRASVIQPDGPGTSAFIVYDNYRVILKWNNSHHFATSVGLMSDRLKRP